MANSILQNFITKYGRPLSYSESGDAKFVCPECNHKSLFGNIYSGKLFCFRCDYGRGLRINGRSIPIKQPKVNLKLQKEILLKVLTFADLDPVHAQVLKKRGIYKPSKYKICTVPFNLAIALNQWFKDTELVESGLFNHLPGVGVIPTPCLYPGNLLIPYWVEGTIQSFKTREDFLPVKEYTLRYSMPRKSIAPKTLFSLKPTYSGDLIVTEGDLKSIATIEAGFDCVNVSGINNWRHPIHRLLQITQDVRRFFVVFDSGPDLLKDWPVLQAVLNIQKAIGPRACIAFLPYDNQKVDLDSFLGKYQPSLLTEVLEDAWVRRNQITKTTAEQLERIPKTRMSYE